MRNGKKEVSIHDVAKLAGVSITTVSRVVNKLSTVKPENQKKVEKAIAELKYEPDANAQRLASGKTNALGFVMPGYPGIFYSYYAVELLRGVGHGCESARLDLIFHITNGFNDLKARAVSGIVFADIIENQRQVEKAIKKGIPCLVINHVVQDKSFNYIAVDNRKGGAIGAEYLYDLGHRRIAMITGSLRMQAGQQRLKGFRECLEKKGCEVDERYIIEGDYSRRSAREATETLLSLPERPTAIFAASDDMALEAVAVIGEKGLRVPEDISIVGFDDNPEALYGAIALTTIRQPLFQMGSLAVKELNGIIQKGKKTGIAKMLDPELVVRDSCAAPKS